MTWSKTIAGPQLTTAEYDASTVALGEIAADSVETIHHPLAPMRDLQGRIYDHFVVARALRAREWQVRTPHQNSVPFKPFHPANPRVHRQSDNLL
jgi:hypothetical protein